MSARRTGIVLVAAVVTALAVTAGGASAAPGGGECQLHGVANLSPALGSASANFSYNFSGSLGSSQLGSCQSNLSGAAPSGTVAAGVTLPETVTLTNTSTGATTTGTVSYQEPIPTGTGSCGDSATTGTALVTWAGGRHTVVAYTTSGAAAAVTLQGTVVANMTLALVTSSVPAGYSAPSTFTIASDDANFPVGDGAIAALAFTPTTQDQDCVNKGVSTANIDGIVGVGSQS